MPKVMFVISGLGAGGAERVISQIASHWNGRGFAVEIASFDTPFDPVFITSPPASDFIVSAQKIRSRRNAS